MKRGRKAIQNGEIKAKVGRPTPPPDLEDYALNAWDSVCDDLESQGNLLLTDNKLIELYSRSYAMLRRIEDQLSVEPLTIDGKEGRTFQHPLLVTHCNLVSRVQRILNDLRLTPATRSKGTIPLEEDSNGWMA